MTATIFTPKDQSLDERIKAWKQVREANRQLKESVKISQSDWLERLGDKKDRLFAQETIANSYLQASQCISKKELEQALENELLTRAEVHELVIAHDKADMKKHYEQRDQNKRDKGRHLSR